MDYLEKYGYAPVDAEIATHLQAVSSTLDALATPEVLKKCFSLMDLTTLKSDDTVASVSALVDKVTRLQAEYPSYPLPASVCVYPNFAPVVRERRCSPELHVTTVASCFPSAQSFLEVKVRECELAVQGGADEVDIVLALNAFLAGDYAAASNEIVQMKQAIDAEAARQGRRADFIKTSTGKVSVNATPGAAWVMCECIKAFHAKTGRKVGFKAAGGISNDRDARYYYAIGATVLGEEWVEKNHFRFGVSRLGNSLMSAIEQKEVKFF